MLRKLALCGVLGWGSMFAATLTFDGAICTGADSTGTGVAGACSDREYISQSYGDGANVDVTYRDLIRTNESLRWWTTAYNDLVNVAWGGDGDGTGQSWNRIEIKPLNGYMVTLNSFSLGAYPSTTRNSNVRVVELTSGNVLTNYGNISVGSGSTSHVDLSPADSSTFGIAIEWRDTAYNVGIDNINFDLSLGTSPVPEPSTFVLLAGGIAAVAARRLRRA